MTVNSNTLLYNLQKNGNSFTELRILCFYGFIPSYVPQHANWDLYSTKYIVPLLKSIRWDYDNRLIKALKRSLRHTTTTYIYVLFVGAHQGVLFRSSRESFKGAYFYWSTQGYTKKWSNV